MCWKRQNTAYVAQEDLIDDEDQSESSEEAAYQCTSCGPDQELEDIEDRIEQDIVVAYVCSGVDLDDKKARERIAGCIHDEINC